VHVIRIAAAAVVAASGLVVQSASALGVHSCPPGYTGVIIENNGSYTSVCQNVGGTSPCPSGTGTVVTVGGKHVSACLTK
jgi:hypothetical protein